MNWVLTQHQFVWNNEQQFLNYLRKKLPVLTGGGTITSFTTTGSSGAATFAGGVLNIPVYSGGGGGNLDATLALGGSLTADRTITYAAHNIVHNGAHIQYTNAIVNATVPIHLYAAFPFGLKERVIVNGGNGDVAWDINYSTDAAADVICVQGWNADQAFNPTQASWTTRMEYQYLGHLYEYHLQFSGGGRVYRILSYTLRDNGGVGPTGDTVLAFMQGGDLELRPLSSNGSYWDCTSSFDSGLDQSIMALRTIGTGLGIYHTLEISQGYKISNPGGATFMQTLGFDNYSWTLTGLVGGTLYLGNDGSGTLLKLTNSVNTRYAYLSVQNDIAHGASVLMTGSTFVGSGVQVADTSVFFGSGAGGYVFYNATATSFFWTYNGTTAASVELKTTGQWRYYKYGVGTFTGTVAKGLAVDTSGNVIETPPVLSGQTTLVSGTKAITVTGVTTGSIAVAGLVAQGGTSTSVYEYKAVCTANTVTITAVTAAGATVTTDTSIVNYILTF